MSSIRCIVAATDFSSFSGQVVAARIARHHDAAMHLLHGARSLDCYPDLTLALDEFTRHDPDMRLGSVSQDVAFAASCVPPAGPGGPG